jgi:hypothetical protein
MEQISRILNQPQAGSKSKAQHAEIFGSNGGD